MALFKAYFTFGRDIGDRTVLKTVAEDCGLDPNELMAALDEGRYTEQVRRGSDAARRDGVTAVPTFIIEGRPAITGAVSEALFREALQEATDALSAGTNNK
jgi:predicted DsbA family dithiol-disulfide isomerase